MSARGNPNATDQDRPDDANVQKESGDSEAAEMAKGSIAETGGGTAAPTGLAETWLPAGAEGDETIDTGDQEPGSEPDRGSDGSSS